MTWWYWCLFHSTCFLDVTSIAFERAEERSGFRWMVRGYSEFSTNIQVWTQLWEVLRRGSKNRATHSSMVIYPPYSVGFPYSCWFTKESAQVHFLSGAIGFCHMGREWDNWATGEPSSSYLITDLWLPFTWLRSRYSPQGSSSVPSPSLMQRLRMRTLWQLQGCRPELTAPGWMRWVDLDSVQMTI